MVDVNERRLLVAFRGTFAFAAEKCPGRVAVVDGLTDGPAPVDVGASEDS